MPNLLGRMGFARRLLLVSLDWTRPKDPPLSLGHASILSNLRHNKIEVIERSWAVNHSSFSPSDVVEFVMRNARSDTDVALGAFVWNEKAIQTILNNIRQHNFTGRVILGGPQVSYVKKGLENFYPQVDIFVRGYAESVLAKFMQNQEKEGLPLIKGIHYAGEPDLGLSATTELETLPSPFLAGLIPPQRFIRWETQRGCPFRCAFCQHRESDVTMKRRQFSMSRIMQEVEWITANSCIQDIAVLDPIFNSGPDYLKILDGLISGGFRGKLSLQCRAEMIKEEFLNKICRLNETAETVLELGLQTIHTDEQAVIDRPNNMRLVSKVLNDIYARGIKSEISLIFGLPKQTVTSFQKSIDFCVQHKVPVIHAFPLMLLRGTPLYERRAELGLVESEEIASASIDRIQDGIPHVVSSPSFTYEDWKTMAKMADALAEYNDGRTKRVITSATAPTSYKQSSLLAHSIWRKRSGPILDDKNTALQQALFNSTPKNR